MFGFIFPENFNYPYISKSITEFWHRWHMTMGGWFRDYVYIPLGGNRCKKSRWLFNIFVVWATTGLWHGAAWNFVLWGLFFGVLMILEKVFWEKHLQGFGPLRYGYTLLLIIVSFAIFNAPSLRQLGADLKAMFGGAPLWSADTAYYLKSYAVMFLIAIVGATPVCKTLWGKLSAKNQTLDAVAEPLFLAVLLFAVTASLVSGGLNPFLYFRF